MEHQQAAKALASLPPREAMRLLREAHIQDLHETESAKDHPLSDFALDPGPWTELKAHLLDGGGVTDDGDLSRAVLQALFDDDQKTFWAGLVHLLKARMNINGRVRKLPFGGVTFSGVAPVKKKEGK